MADSEDQSFPPVFDIIPDNPPPSVIITTPDKHFKRLNSRYSLFSEFNDSFDGEDGQGVGYNGTKCTPQVCPENETQPDVSHLPSVTSILDYEVVHGLLKPGVLRSETEAFVPVGGMVAPEKKRQEFQDYLHKKGFISAIARVIISLYDESELPSKDTANEYIAKCLGFSSSEKGELAETKTYCHILRVRIQRLQVENDWMRRHLDNYEITETALDIVDPTALPAIKYLNLEVHHKHGHKHKKRNKSKAKSSARLVSKTRLEL